MMMTYMPRPKQETKARTIRFLVEVAEAIDKYAEKELISGNLAVNKLLIAKLTELGYMEESNND